MEPVIVAGDIALTVVELVGAVALLLLGLWLGSFLRRNDGQTHAELMAMRGQQAELQGRLAQLSDEQAQRGDLFQKRLDDRLAAMSERVGQSITEQTEKSAEQLKRLDTRLEVIDRAQANIKELAGEVSGLQSILSNKQARGAFGEKQMQSLIEQFLPPRTYSFQQTLSNAARVDALIHLPGDHLDVAVDSKFPLEAWQRLMQSEEGEDVIKARRLFADDCKRHIRDIADKYLLPGETHEIALMFLPSEAIYAELHARFPKVVERGFTDRVMIVSPTTFMATLHTMNAVLRDAAMREQATVILDEVGKIATDVQRLDARIAKLQSHYDGGLEMMRQARISTEKITRRADRIEALDLDDDIETLPVDPPQQAGLSS
ncbi:DNA recombination protein RmuC [Algimonas porphyrae]|uniref:DNA recombination protein RmuC homolog n=1 Tax=Algimonas porphyrae TaxID=1128113 RepID=A0ABQ5UYH6_9PROT|nr:DNA recombination protein RmuC [Algimonas porphyrae]GLQ19974.1 DNA recombination protein RmuC [Algimonas porphyrae]